MKTITITQEYNEKYKGMLVTAIMEIDENKKYEYSRLFDTPDNISDEQYQRFFAEMITAFRKKGF